MACVPCCTPFWHKPNGSVPGWEKCVMGESHDFHQVDFPINRGPLRLLKISLVAKRINLRNIFSIILKYSNIIIKYDNLNIHF